jgi:hypothetical protein
MYVYFLYSCIFILLIQYSFHFCYNVARIQYRFIRFSAPYRYDSPKMFR